MAKRGPKPKKKYDPYRRPDGTVDYNLVRKIKSQNRKIEKEKILHEHRDEIFAHGTKSFFIRCPVCLRKAPLLAKVIPDGTRVGSKEIGVNFVERNGKLQRRFVGAEMPDYTYYPVSAEYFYPRMGSVIKPDESFTPLQLQESDERIYRDFKRILYKTGQLFP